MAGALTGADGVMARCASFQEQESRMRNYLVQKSRSTVETSGAVFGNKVQNKVVIPLCVYCLYAVTALGWSTAVSQRFYSQIVR